MSSIPGRSIQGHHPNSHQPAYRLQSHNYQSINGSSQSDYPVHRVAQSPEAARRQAVREAYVRSLLQKEQSLIEDIA